MECKEKLELARDWYNDQSTTQKEKVLLETIFPELKNEDERIRTFLYKTFTAQYLAKDKLGKWHGEPVANILAWLEEKDKKEYALKSFKDEDVHEFVQYIERQAKAYELNLPNRSYDIYGFAKDILSWFEKQRSQILANSAKTCKDAPKFKVDDWVINNITKKVEQVIDITDSDYICSGTMIVSFNNQHLLKGWTIQDAKDGDVLCSGQIILLFKKWESNDWNFAIAYAGIDISGKLQITDKHWLISNNAHPATEEQRDLLFQKMKEAGYDWNAEKKELKRIEQNPAWTEEDEKIQSTLIRWQEEWLSSQKNGGYMDNGNLIKGIEESISWLQHIKEKYTWKPSDEQMEMLQYLCETSSHPNEKVIPTLQSLYNDLKKLK